MSVIDELTVINKLAREIVAADYGSKGFSEVAKSIRDGFDGFDLDIEAARLGLQEGIRIGREQMAIEIAAAIRNSTDEK